MSRLAILDRSRSELADRAAAVHNGNMIKHENTTALVTGGASGIGKALAQGLIARGAYVMIADLDQANVDAAVAELGPNARGAACDLAEPDAAAKRVSGAFAWGARPALRGSNTSLGHNTA